MSSSDQVSPFPSVVKDGPSMPEVTGRLRWDRNFLYLGRFYCGAVHRARNGGYWESVVGGSWWPYDTEQAARDALIARVVAAIRDDEA